MKKLLLLLLCVPLMFSCGEKEEENKQDDNIKEGLSEFKKNMEIHKNLIKAINDYYEVNRIAHSVENKPGKVESNDIPPIINHQTEGSIYDISEYFTKDFIYIRYTSNYTYKCKDDDGYYMWPKNIYTKSEYLEMLESFYQMEGSFEIYEDGALYHPGQNDDYEFSGDVRWYYSGERLKPFDIPISFTGYEVIYFRDSKIYKIEEWADNGRRELLHRFPPEEEIEDVPGKENEGLSIQEMREKARNRIIK